VSKVHESRKPDGSHYSWFIECPGCGQLHSFDTRWTFNGDLEKPTFRASMLVISGNETGPTRCHSFVTDGKIAFCPDSTHELSGKTVDLPDWSRKWEVDT
jgi:hypothetical protein